MEIELERIDDNLRKRRRQKEIVDEEKEIEDRMGAWVNSVDENGMCALLGACISGNIRSLCVCALFYLLQNVSVCSVFVCCVLTIPTASR